MSGDCVPYIHSGLTCSAAQQQAPDVRDFIGFDINGVTAVLSQ
jgi:hypothetical protein